VATPPFGKIFRDHVRTVLGTRVSNLKSVLELLAFNAQKFRGSRDRDHAPFWENFLVFLSGLSLGTRVSNLKSVAVTILELLALNSHDRPLRTDRQTDRQRHTHRTNTLSPPFTSFTWRR